MRENSQVRIVGMAAGRAVNAATSAFFWAGAANNLSGKTPLEIKLWRGGVGLGLSVALGLKRKQTM